MFSGLYGWLSSLWRSPSRPDPELTQREAVTEFGSPEDIYPFLEMNVVEPKLLTKRRIGSIGVYQLSPTTVLKRVYGVKSAFEPYTMAFVTAQTSIPVPKVGTYFFYDRYLYIAMDYIEGEDLDSLWPKLSVWRKLWILWTIRGYIRQLRSLRLARPDVPGPIDGTGSPVRCEGAQFSPRGAGPFPTYDDMSEWFDYKLAVSLAMEKRHKHLKFAPRSPFDRSMPLVFTHGDILPRNVRIGKDGTIWLMDWGFAGVYPKWFEYYGMVKHDRRLFPQEYKLPWLWARLIPFMAGSYWPQASSCRRIIRAVDNPNFKLTKKA